MIEARSLICSKKVTIESVLQCLLGLRKLEVDVYSSLLEKAGTPDEISKRIGKSRSLVQRALQNLVSYGMAYRKPVMRTRGRAFEYAPVEKDEIKRNLRETLQTWTNNIEKAIDEW